MSTDNLYNEKELLFLLNKGDEQAFEQLYHSYSPRIFGNLVKLLKSEDIAEELLQDVFIKIWQRRSGIDPEQSFRSYLFRIAENSVYDFFRRTARDKLLQAKLQE
ncbi:MAG TPA: sigma-70 family RNA polymerase sigma factor, partial [Parasegetibacter sp.]